jgi:predicted nuclease of predicted toxin-antitoxin system
MKIRLVADENFHGAVVRGLLRRPRSVDIVRVQDVGLSGAEDSVILDWAAREGRVLLTHDISTVPPFAHQRVEAGQPMPGVIVACESLPIGRVIDDLLFILECSKPGEWEDQLRYLPL